MPKPLIQAFIASEDRRFTNTGVDYQGILRAIFSMRSAKVMEGGSTITQQMAQFSSQSGAQRLRKIKEVRLSQKIEQKLSKDQILGATSTWST